MKPYSFILCQAQQDMSSLKNMAEETKKKLSSVASSLWVWKVYVLIILRPNPVHIHFLFLIPFTISKSFDSILVLGGKL